MIRAQQKEATRERVFAAALRLFDQRGYEETSVEDIVRASRVARGTFYVHFPAKDDVLIELIRRSDAKICARMRKTGRRARGLRAVLAATAKAFADSWRGRRALLPHAGAVAMRRIAGVAHERDVQPLRIELAAQITATRRELRASLPPQMLADVFLLDVFAALMAWAATGAPALDRVMAGVIDLFLRGAGRAVRSSR